ncbi:MAG: serine protease [Pseudomonadota bacterium]
MGRIVIAWVLWMATVTGAAAQDNTWIQVEAQPSLRQALERVQVYSQRLPNVAAFQVSSRWYGIAIGPYEEIEAEEQLDVLERRREVPFDAFLVDGSAFLRQVWPLANQAAAQVTTETPTDTLSEDLAETTTETPAPAAAAAEPTAPAVPDETPAQARASEAQLTRDEKRLLQTALQAEGFYTSTIDGLFGRGTRASMSAWQAANGFEATGVMTTAQRAALIADYNAILDGLGMARAEDLEAGIAMQLPLAELAFKTYEPPFAHYASAGDLGVRLSLISQDGNRTRFRVLYDLMQTLDDVPTNGPRSIGRDRFTITGIDATRHTTVEVRYDSGVMKGFMLVWPAGDEERLTRVLAEMRASFRALPGVLDPNAYPPTEDQRPDLLSGLDIRKAERTATGLFVDTRGVVLTAAQSVAGCERVSLAGATDATVIFSDAALGLAALMPQDDLAPIATAGFQTRVPRLGDDVAVAGFSFGGTLGAPTLTLGTLTGMQGLDGEAPVKRLDLKAEPGDVGGPVFDRSGAVLGVLLPAPSQEAQVLPPFVRYAVDTDGIRARLADAGLTIREVRGGGGVLDPVELSELAADMTVLVECW